MTALISGIGSAYQPHEQLAIRYLCATIQRDANGPPWFAKYSILQDSDLLFEIAHAIQKRLPKRVRHLCCLLDSGLPLASAMACIGKYPLFFFDHYRRSSVRGSDGSARLILSDGLRGACALVDSHIRSGYTSSTAYGCVDATQRLIPATVVAPVQFDSCFNERYSRDTDYELLATFSRVQEAVARQIGIEPVALGDLVSGQNPGFWPSGTPIADSRPSPLGSFREEEQRSGSANFADPALADQSMAEVLRTDLRGPGSMELMLQPQALERTCRELTKTVAAVRPDLLLGLDLDGCALATAVAYYGRRDLTSRLLYCLQDKGVVPRSSVTLDGTAVAIVGQLGTGARALDAVEKLRQSGGRITHLLSVEPPPSDSWQAARWENSRKMLDRQNVTIVW